MTARELAQLENKCRYALQKQGMKLHKQRMTTINFNPAACRYRISGGDQSNGSGYPLRLSDVMQAAGIG